MALNEAQVVANELERVRPNVPTLFDFDSKFYGTIEKREVEKVSNRQMRIPLEINPGGRFGHFDPDGGSLGLGDGPSFDKGVIDTVHLSKPVEWTKKAEWATDDARKAVLNTTRHLLAKSMAEFRRSVDSLCMTAGDGVLGTVTSSATGGGKDTLTLTTDGFGARLLRYGMYHSIYNAALTVRRTYTGGTSTGGEAKFDLLDLAAKTARADGTTGATIATDKIVASGLTATPPVSLLGVPYHHSSASTGSWLGLDRATIPTIRANSVSAGGGAFSMPFARLAMNKAMDRAGMDSRKSMVAFMHPCQKQAYEEMGQAVSIIQKQAKEENLDLYFGDGMQMAGAPISESFSWDKTRIDFIIKEVWGRAEMHPAGFYEVEGRKIFEKRSTDGSVSTAMLFYITASFNLFVNNPTICSYISSLSVPTGY